MNRYTLKQLEHDLIELAKRAEDLDKLNIPEKYQTTELTEKIIAPIYLAKQVELFGRYFDIRLTVRTDGLQEKKADK